MSRAVVVFGDNLESTAATNNEGAPIVVEGVSFDLFCRLVQHMESHKDELERFLKFVLNGKTTEAEAVAAELPSLPPDEQPRIAADLVTAFGDARAEIKVNSLACKIHNLRVPDEPFMDRLLAVLNDSSSYPSRLLNACLVNNVPQAPVVQKSPDSRRGEGTSRKLLCYPPSHGRYHDDGGDNNDDDDELRSPADLPRPSSKLLIAQEAMSDAPMEAATCWIPPHSKDDDAYLTTWRLNPRYVRAHNGVKAGQAIRKAIELLRSESWSVKARFMVWYCDQDSDVNLERFFKTNDDGHDVLDEADHWVKGARRVLSRFSAQLRLRLNPANNDIQARNGEQLMLLISWGKHFHRLAEGVVCDILTKASYLSADEQKGQSVILYGCRAATLLDHFTPEEAQAISARAGGHWSEVNIVLQRIDAEWERACREEDGDGRRAVSSADFLSRVGFSGPLLENRLLPIARELDEFGSPGYTIRDIARCAVLQIACPISRPYIGEDVLVGKSEPRTTDANNKRTVDVTKVKGKELLGKSKHGSLLERLPDSLDDILKAADDKYIRLYHGTSQSAATSILRDGVDVDRLQWSSDFSRGFYTTPFLPYALQCALHCGHTSNDPNDHAAVLVFDVLKKELPAPKLDLVSEAAVNDWRQLVHRCRTSSVRSLRRENQTLYDRFNAARLVCGPVTNNAGVVDLHRSPRPPMPLTVHGHPVLQHVFRGHGLDFPVLYAIIEQDPSVFYGHVSVVVVAMDDMEFEW